MPFDLADVVPVTVDIKDANGTLANAGAVTLTITLPDNTTATPAVSNPSTGRYQVDYATVQAGRHVVRWVATGANAGAYTDMFDVRQATPPLIISLKDARRHLNISTTDAARDEEIRQVIEATTHVVEFFVGPVVRQTIIEEHRERSMQVLALSRPPIISLTSVVAILDGGTNYTVGDLDVSTSTGIVQRKDGGWFVGPLRSTYVAGRSVITANITEASEIILGHIWRTQNGSDGLPSLSGDDYSVSQPIPGLGYAVPNRALELLGAHRLAPQVG